MAGKKLLRRGVAAGVTFGLGIASMTGTAEAAPQPRARIVSESSTYAEIRVQSQRLERVGQVCVELHFGSQNPLDPGEEFEIGGLGGFANNGTEPLLVREVCVPEVDQDLSRFADGKEKLRVSILGGTVDFQSAGYDVFGIPAHDK